MKNAAKLDDFAHDICVSGLGIAFVSIVGIAMVRPGTDSRRSPRNDLPAPLSWTEAGWTETATPALSAGMKTTSTASSSQARESAEQAHAPEVFAVDLQRVGEPQRILLAGESAGAESSAAR